MTSSTACSVASTILTSSRRQPARAGIYFRPILRQQQAVAADAVVFPQCQADEIRAISVITFGTMSMRLELPKASEDIALRIPSTRPRMAATVKPNAELRDQFVLAYAYRRQQLQNERSAYPRAWHQKSLAASC